MASLQTILLRSPYDTTPPSWSRPSAGVKFSTTPSNPWPSQVLEQRSRQESPCSTHSTVTEASGCFDDEVGTTQIKQGTDDVPATIHRQVAEPALSAPAASNNTLQTILSRYETVMSERAHRPDCDAPSVHDDGDTTPPSDGRHDRETFTHEVAPSSTVARGRSQMAPVRRGGKRRARASLRRVQKKRASTRHGQEYMVLRLGDVRVRQGKRMEFKVMWAPTWLTLDDLRGPGAFEEAEKLAVDTFGRNEWEKEALASGLQEPRESLDMDSEAEYASE